MVRVNYIRYIIIHFTEIILLNILEYRIFIDRVVLIKTNQYYC